MNFIRFALVFGVLVSPSFAARYLVKFHDDQTMREVSYHAKRSQERAAFGGSFLAVPSVSRAAVLNVSALAVNTLDNLDLMQVELESDHDAQLLASNPEVAFVEKEEFFAAPQFSPMSLQDQEITWGLHAVEAQGAWAQGERGASARVLVLDTGIDKNHPDLAQNFVEGKSFIHGFTPDFVPANVLGNSLFDSIKAGAEAAQANNYLYFDDVGHGTHVAGTISALKNGVGVAGVAPDSEVLAGKVCSRIGCSSFAIIAGMDWAIEKDAQIVNMSLGGPVPSRSQMMAAERLEEAGVTVIAAAGNDGESTKNKISFPAGYPTVFSVGALTPELVRAGFSQYGPNLDITAPGTEVDSTVPVGSGRESLVKLHFEGETQRVKSSSFVGSEDNEEPIRADMVFAGLGREADFDADTDYKGKMVLVKRGEITFKLKVQNALDQGAAGVIIFNNTTGLVSGSITTDGSSIGVPVAMVEQHVGEAIVAQLEEDKAVAASVSVDRTDYAGFAGTSMASPHVAGVAALIASSNPGLSPEEIREILRESATPVSIPTPDNEYGAGIVNANAAVALAKAASGSAESFLAPRH